MAEILPKKLFGQVPTEITKLFNRLKGLDDNFRIRWTIPGLATSPRPNFAVFYQEKFVFLISVSCLSLPEAQKMLKKRFEPIFPALLSERPANLEDFAKNEKAILAQALNEASGTNPAFAPQGVAAAVAFPNISQSILDAIIKARPFPFICLGKESLTSLNLEKRLLSLASHPAAPDTIDRIRAWFSPEVRIPGRMIPRRHKIDYVAASLTPYLLDYDQENAVKMDLALSPEAENVIGAASPRLITGVAGSGKTLVLLYRAALLSRLNPEKRCLILTHNKPLIYDLRRRLDQIIRSQEQKKKIDCIHFASWCRRIGNDKMNIISFREKEELVSEAAQTGA